MKPLVLQSDFGLVDGAVSAMYGVAEGVSDDLRVYNLTHDIPQYNIWEASYRLIQTTCYWPVGTVFVSVVDPGVGSERKSVVVETLTGHYIVTPDNGTLTHIKKLSGIKEARIIDERINRLPNSGESYTFHGRDIYAYTGARLAAGIISFADVGPLYNPSDVVELPLIDATLEKGVLKGTIDVLDVRFGSIWTNIPRELFKEIGVNHGQHVEVTVEHESRIIYKNTITYAKSFADVQLGETLLYVNSLDNMAVAINQGSFAKAYNVETGISWKVSLRKAPRILYEDGE